MNRFIYLLIVASLFSCREFNNIDEIGVEVNKSENQNNYIPNNFYFLPNGFKVSYPSIISSFKEGTKSSFPC